MNSQPIPREPRHTLASPLANTIPTKEKPPFGRNHLLPAQDFKPMKRFQYAAAHMKRLLTQRAQRFEKAVTMPTIAPRLDLNV
jgi:hypothetical protein